LNISKESMPLHPVDLIADNIEHIPIPVDPVRGICAVTGREDWCIPFKACFGNSFTNLNILPAPGSGLVGLNAFQAIKHKPARMSSWIAMQDDFLRFGKSVDGDGWRSRILGYILTPPEVPWAAYITTSYKKHGVLLTPLNSGKKSIWIFEMLQVDCSDARKVQDYWQRLNVALRKGFSRTILESCRCPAFVMKKAGIAEWMQFERWATGKYQSPLYKFICYLLPSQEELKHENMHD